MDLINCSLNVIDTLFSTRSRGPGEPECPGGTFPAGYTMDGWHNWRVMCLAGLSIEDTEDIYLFGTMITGFLLIGAGLALTYRRIKKVESAVQPPTRLPAGIETMGRGLSSQNGLIECSTDKILEKLAAAVNTQNNTSERKLDHILEKLTAVVSSQNLFFEHNNDNITERKFDNIMEKLTALQREIERPVSDC